jgi:hypothetical protein
MLGKGSLKQGLSETRVIDYEEKRARHVLIVKLYSERITI